MCGMWFPSGEEQSSNNTEFVRQSVSRSHVSARAIGTLKKLFRPQFFVPFISCAMLWTYALLSFAGALKQSYEGKKLSTGVLLIIFSNFSVAAGGTCCAIASFKSTPSHILGWAVHEVEQEHFSLVKAINLLTNLAFVIYAVVALLYGVLYKLYDRAIYPDKSIGYFNELVPYNLVLAVVFDALISPMWYVWIPYVAVYLLGIKVQVFNVKRFVELISAKISDLNLPIDDARELSKSFSCLQFSMESCCETFKPCVSVSLLSFATLAVFAILEARSYLVGTGNVTFTAFLVLLFTGFANLLMLVGFIYSCANVSDLHLSLSKYLKILVQSADQHHRSDRSVYQELVNLSSNAIQTKITWTLYGGTVITQREFANFVYLVVALSVYFLQSVLNY